MAKSQPIKFKIDDKLYEGDPEKNLLETCLSAGLNLPYFCWHPAMGSVGACRQCAVKQFKDENDKRGKLVMACMTPIHEGAIFSVQDDQARDFRASVIEWLMLNHPHDCPVCDEGGECHLQDMTVMTGHTYRRTRFKKRTFRNQDLGPLVNHEMNRCIACYRCVRFYRDYAGGHDLNVFSVHDDVYFGRHEDGVLESEFSGNLVEICPTGVFTDKTLKRHYTRKWDLQTAPSICAHCSVGCNTLPGERYGTIRRVRNRYHDEINGYFLCDRGRYGYEFTNSEKRVREPWVRHGRKSVAVQASPSAVLQKLASKLRESFSRDAVIGIGSPRASLEANAALRSLVGQGSFFSGMSDSDQELTELVIKIQKEASFPFASVRDIERADAVLVLGEDVTNTAPRLDLAIRQAIRNLPETPAPELRIPGWQDAAVREIVQERKAPLFILTSHHAKLESVATGSLHLAPDDIARMGFAIAHAVDETFPEVTSLRDDQHRYCRTIARTLLSARRPVVVSGTGAGSSAILRAASNIASALGARNSEARISITLPEVNSVGLALLTPRPLSELISRSENQSPEVLIVLENDLFRRGPRDKIKRLLDVAPLVLLLEHTATGTIPYSDIILPTTPYLESNGSFVNYESRAQRFYPVFSAHESPEPSSVRESWSWIGSLREATGRGQSWSSIDDLIRELVGQESRFQALRDSAPPARFRIHGSKIARKSHRSSGRTSMYANRTVREPKPPSDPNSSFAFSMEGYQLEGLQRVTPENLIPSPLIPRYWAPGWNSVQALNKFQEEVGKALRGGPSGKKFFAPSAAPGRRLTFGEIPTAFNPRSEEWLTIPIHHIFGSEELSRLAQGIAQLAPRPYVAIHPEDAALLEAQEGTPIQVLLAETESRRFPARLDPSLPRGVIGIPVGLPETDGIQVLLPAWSKLAAGTDKRLPGAA